MQRPWGPYHNHTPRCFSKRDVIPDSQIQCALSSPHLTWTLILQHLALLATAFLPSFSPLASNSIWSCYFCCHYFLFPWPTPLSPSLLNIGVPQNSRNRILILHVPEWSYPCPQFLSRVCWWLHLYLKQNEEGQGRLSEPRNYPQISNLTWKFVFAHRESSAGLGDCPPYDDLVIQL
jgi:hypothetical protein